MKSLLEPGVCVVATGHEEVTRAAEIILEAGGNAFDAAIAAGLTSSVAEPTLTALGGGGFLMARTANGDAKLIDFFTDTPGRGVPEDQATDFMGVTVKFPGADQLFHIGRGSIAVPGILAGFAHVLERYGTMPLRDVVEPAVACARRGVPLTAQQRSFVQLLWPILTSTASSRAIYSPLPEVGGKLNLADAGDFLDSLPDGALESFYFGDLAARIDSDMRAGGGLLRREDLAAYEVKERAPIDVDYRGHRVLLNPLPSGGGLRMARFLEVLTDRGVEAGDAAFLGGLIDAFRDGESIPLEVLAPRFSRGTTHLTVADDLGNVATMTTSNGEGSAYVVPGTGVMLNNMLGEEDLYPHGFARHPPGLRVSSMMCPTIVEDDAGAPVLALGSGGSQRIRTAVTQVLVRVLDRGEDLEDAVRAPRAHFDGQTVQIEPGFSEDVLDAARDRYDDVNVWAESNLYFGGVHAVLPGAKAAGDPRRGGCARIVRRRPAG